MASDLFLVCFVAISAGTENTTRSCTSSDKQDPTKVFKNPPKMGKPEAGIELGPGHSQLGALPLHLLPICVKLFFRFYILPSNKPFDFNLFYYTTFILYLFIYKFIIYYYICILTIWKVPYRRTRTASDMILAPAPVQHR
jgi:hypothetical protein